jgi:hypothetical protein
MQQGCPQPHEEVPSALETLLLESASYHNMKPKDCSKYTCHTRDYNKSWGAKESTSQQYKFHIITEEYKSSHISCSSKNYLILQEFQRAFHIVHFLCFLNVNI